jgi:transposase-like protein
LHSIQDSFKIPATQYYWVNITMPGKRHSEEEIAVILNEWSDGVKVEELAKKHSVTVQSLYRWKRLAVADKRTKGSKSGAKTRSQPGAKPSLSATIGPPKTLSELRAENARLKAIIADLLMEKYKTA